MSIIVETIGPDDEEYADLVDLFSTPHGLSAEMPEDQDIADDVVDDYSHLYSFMVDENADVIIDQKSKPA